MRLTFIALLLLNGATGYGSANLLQSSLAGRAAPAPVAGTRSRPALSRQRREQPQMQSQRASPHRFGRDAASAPSQLAADATFLSRAQMRRAGLPMYRIRADSVSIRTTRPNAYATAPGAGFGGGDDRRKPPKKGKSGKKKVGGKSGWDMETRLRAAAEAEAKAKARADSEEQAVETTEKPGVLAGGRNSAGGAKAIAEAEAKA
eukprot:4263540-Pleurochrysis_carterae.AAC.1